MSSHNYKSVLPDNSTPVMRAIEKAFRSQLESVNDPFPELLNPKLTPAQFLSALAKENGVDDWFSGDSEQQQRETTSGALLFQKSAGTRAGLKESLLALGISSEINKGDAPYSLNIEGKLPDEPLTDETSKRLNARVQKYKSERDDIHITLSRSNNGAETKAAIVQTARFIHVFAGVPVPPVSYGSNPKFGFVQSEKVIKVNAGFGSTPNFLNLSTRTEQCCLLGFKDNHKDAL